MSNKERVGNKLYKIVMGNRELIGNKSYESIDNTCTLTDKEILCVGQDITTLEEFKSIFYKNNHNDSIITKKYLDEYMELFINFRLKVKEAQVLGFDTIQDFVNELVS